MIFETKHVRFPKASTVEFAISQLGRHKSVFMERYVGKGHFYETPNIMKSYSTASR